MIEKKDGQTYAPVGRAAPVCKPGEFPFGVIGLDHGHIFGMCNGLLEAGAELTLVWDSDAEKLRAFLEKYPGACAAQSPEQLFADPRIKLIASAAIPADRAALGLRALASGKDFFADKPAMTTQAQIDELRRAAEESGKKCFIYFSERLHVEASVYAERLIAEGRIGRVVQVVGFGPHRLDADKRPDWFFDPRSYGGILTDIGCHQIEQLLFFAGAKDARLACCRVANYAHPEHPEFQDFGEVSMVCDNGVSGYFRVDWFTPNGLGAWGDGRTLILGEKGYIELRKYLNVAESAEGDHVFWVDDAGEHHCRAGGACGFPFFGRLIRDCLDRTETAMPQDYIFRVMELAIEAQNTAVWLKREE